jgi:hypothetical protein
MLFKSLVSKIRGRINEGIPQQKKDNSALLDIELCIDIINKENCGDNIEVLGEYKFIENYISYMEIINYLITPIKKRICLSIHSSLILDTEYDCDNECDCPIYIFEDDY